MPSPWRRAIATLVGLWFALSVSGVALQLCPEHGMRMMAGMRGGANCDPADAAGSRGGTQQSGDSQNTQHDDCTCTGMCCVTAAVTLAPAPLVPIPVVVAETPPIAPLGTRELAPRAAPDVILPPPLGPPTLRT
jgi:Protein of unknown function (DUF2946)